jgi:hypothetical protein
VGAALLIDRGVSNGGHAHWRQAWVASTSRSIGEGRDWSSGEGSRGWMCVHVNGPRHGPRHRQLSRHWSCGPASFSEYCNMPWPLNPQKAKSTTQTKAAKASNSYNSRPCGVRQLHNCNPPRPRVPVPSTLIQPAPSVARARLYTPLPLWVSACPDGSDSRCLAPFCRCIWKQTHLLRLHRANPGPSHSHTPSLSCRHPFHCRSGTRFLSTAVF